MEYYYNLNVETKKAYDYNGIVVGVNYNQEDNENTSLFEKCNFEDKLDILSEIIIRFDNNSLFEKIDLSNIFKIETNGFEIARLIKEYKNK